MPKQKSTSRRPKRHRDAPTPAAVINFRAARAAMLDRLADLELQHGHHDAAERLAHAATELRDGAR